MQKEWISGRQAVSIIILFVIGNSVVLGVNAQSGQDSWISLILAAVVMLPLGWIYARIAKLFPDRDFYEIMTFLFGKLAGKGMALLFAWYGLHLGAMVMRYFSEFTKIVSMPETPLLPLMIALILVVVYLAKSGIEILGKWAVVILAVVGSMILFTIVFSVEHMEWTHLLPVMTHPPRELLAGGVRLVSSPLGEIVLFLPLLGAVKKGESPYRIYFYGILFSSLILLLVVLRNLTSIGVPMTESAYFPSYITARIIDLGEFFTRIEGMISINFLLAGITKITVCLLASAKGFAKFFNIREHRLLMPTGLCMLALCAVIYENAMEMFAFSEIYQFYAIPFQLILPFMIWIGAEIKGTGK